MVASLETKAAVKQILMDMTPQFDEKQRRILYGSVATVLGYGGISFVNETTDSVRYTITSGMEEITLSADVVSAANITDGSRIPDLMPVEKVLLRRIPSFMKRLRRLSLKMGTPMKPPKSHCDGQHGASKKSLEN